MKRKYRLMKEYIPKNETWLRLQIKQFVAFNPKREINEDAGSRSCIKFSPIPR